MTSTCALCSQTFSARHSYGLCPNCTSRDRLREFDRVESAIRLAHKDHVTPVTLTLVEWLSTTSDFAGLCSFCAQYQYSIIEMVARDKGLTYDNVVPACRACHVRRGQGYERTEDAVKWYLSAERTPRLIPQNEEPQAL